MAGAPDPAARKPRVVLAKPDVVLAVPRVVAGKPGVVLAVPRMVPGKPDVVPAVPRVVAGKPDVVLAVPRVVAGKPDVVPAVPRVVAGKRGVKIRRWVAFCRQWKPAGDGRGIVLCSPGDGTGPPRRQPGICGRVRRMIFRLFRPSEAIRQKRCACGKCWWVTKEKIGMDKRFTVNESRDTAKVCK